MRFALVTVVFGSLCVLWLASGTNYHGKCQLTRGIMVHALAVRILREGETVKLGALVARNRMLSRFSPFVRLAEDSSRLPEYELIAYDKNLNGDYCYQESRATEFVPPPEWPRLSFDQMRDVAVWKFDTSLNPFNVSADFPFLFPENGEHGKLSKAIENTRIGDKCTVQWVNEVLDESNWSLKLSRWTEDATITVLKECKEAFCKDGVCNVNGQYDYCVTDEARKSDARKHLGGFLICHGSPIGVLPLEGKKKASKGLILFVNLLTVWHTYEKHENDKSRFTSVKDRLRNDVTAVAPTTLTTTGDLQWSAGVGVVEVRVEVDEDKDIDANDDDDDDNSDDSNQKPSSSPPPPPPPSSSSGDDGDTRSGASKLAPGVLALCILPISGCHLLE